MYSDSVDRIKDKFVEDRAFNCVMMAASIIGVAMTVVDIVIAGTPFGG
jgi:hypothetical protein